MKPLSFDRILDDQYLQDCGQDFKLLRGEADWIPQVDVRHASRKVPIVIASHLLNLIA
jgi:hypothetical protein